VWNNFFYFCLSNVSCVFLSQHKLSKLICYSSPVLVCRVITVGTTNSAAKVIESNQTYLESIVSHARKFTHAAGLLEHDNRLLAANVTWWNSEVKMVRSVLNIPNEKLDRLDTQKLSHHECTLLADLVEVLSPFEEATDYAKNQKTTTAGYLIPNILGLKAELRNMRSKFNSKLVSTLTASVTRLLLSYEDRESLILVSILDPRFRLLWCAYDSVEYSSKRAL